MARFVLVPGFWLGGWAWDGVAAGLRAAGHDAVQVTLPGLESASTDRSAVRLDDHVAAVVSALEADRDEPAVLVGHSGAGPVIYGATDRAPELVRRGIYVDAFPVPDGAAIRPGSDPGEVEFPLPSWAELAEEGASIEGLSEQQLAEFRDRAVPHPAGPSRDPLRLVDPRRLAVPVTWITAEIPSQHIRAMITKGEAYFAELPRLADLTLVDLPGGHWPMWSRTEDLTHELLKAAGPDRELS